MKLLKNTEMLKKKVVNAKKIFWGNLRKTNRDAPTKTRVEFLRKIPIFSKLSKNQLEEVANIVYERHYDENEFIFQMNQPGAALFMIQEGQVAVEIPTEEGVAQLAVLKHNAFIGEIALLDDSPRSASAKALEHTTALALSRDDLNTLLQTEPVIASQIYKSLATIIATRLKATNELLEKESEAAA